jgi:drug/metabolite transporter (DMT)-like permease
MKWRIWGALLTVYIVWGSTYLAIRLAVASIPPFWMAATRFLVAGTFLYAWARLSGAPRPTRSEWRATAIAGLFLLVGGNGLLVWAEQRVVSGAASLFIGATPLWMVFLDAFRTRSRPTWRTLAGLGIGLLGIVFLVGPWRGGGEPVDGVGAIALLGAAFLWAIGSVYSRDAPLPASPLLGPSMEMLVGSVGLFILGVLSGEWQGLHLETITSRSLMAVAYLIVFGSLVAYSAYTWLLRHAPTALVATYAYVNPLVAVFLGNLIAGEPLTPRILFSAAIIIGGVVLINTARKPVPRRASLLEDQTPAAD